MSDPDAPVLLTREMVDTLAEHKVVYTGGPEGTQPA